MATIFALSSGSLPAALAIFRISGPKSKDTLLRISKKKVWTPRYMRYTKLHDIRGSEFDSAMAVYLPGPATFTGEDCVEITLHGSSAIVKRMNDTLSALPGLRHATAGEFTKRALVNGKIGIHEMHALSCILQSTTPRQLEQAARAYSQGDWLQHKITRIRTKLALVADFGEDVHSDPNEIRKEIEYLLNEIKEKRRKGVAANRVRKGMKIVMVGRPNVGKSSIFNRLCGYDKAIVSPIFGTTRDCLSFKRLIGGINVTIEDTAGIHQSRDPIEKIGIERTMERMNGADLILVVMDSSRQDNGIYSLIPSNIPYLTVFNKADLIKNTQLIDHSEACLTIATSSNGCDSLEKLLEKRMIEMCPPNAELSLSAGIVEVENLLHECLSHDDIGLINEILQMASEAWGRAETNEELIANIMKNFCIGK